MSRRFALTASLCAAIAAGAFFAGRAVSDEAPPGTPDEKKVAEMMKEMEKLKAPGPQHDVLKGMEGTWVGTGTWTDSGMTSKFTEQVTSKMVYGGRFLQSEASMTGEAPPPVGKFTMVSTIFMGYDNAKQKYVHAMLGDWGTGIGTAEGTYDAAAKKLTMTGVETMGPGQERKFRMVQTFTSPTEWLFEMYFTQPDGQELKAGGGVYKKQ